MSRAFGCEWSRCVSGSVRGCCFGDPHQDVLLREGSVARHLSASLRCIVRSGHDPQGLNQFVDVATRVGVMPIPSRVGSCPSFTRQSAARGSGSRRRAGGHRISSGAPLVGGAHHTEVVLGVGSHVWPLVQSIPAPGCRRCTHRSPTNPKPIIVVARQICAGDFRLQVREVPLDRTDLDRFQVDEDGRTVAGEDVHRVSRTVQHVARPVA